MSAIFWFRRDLRLADNEALTEAVRFATQDRSAKIIPCVNFNR
ncbi:MAG: hypothetical protein EBR26_01725, partial [Microbacteriaceae bacterium]|nr:hypothetical protein [Microbacteriaceae bacterium]